MAVKMAINGFGRIGRLAFRQMMKADDIEVVAANDLTDAKTLAHLLKYDTAQGSYEGTVEVKDGAIVVDGKEIKILCEKDPANLPWGEMGVDVVIESTGFFTTKELAGKHLEAGAKKVMVSAPAKGGVPTVVYNVNHKDLTKDDHIVSGASCTTNCLGPVAKVLNEKFGLKRGWMTTIHAYTADQRMQDAPHKDLRRARAGAANIIPTSTGAAAAIGLVIPELAGKLDGIAVRVPTITGSIVDLVVETEKQCSVEDINAAMKEAAEGELKDTFEYTEDPIVSSDVIGSTAGSVFDADSTKVMDGNMVKVLSWYDNENSYVSQFVRLAKYMADELI
ncbi:type I glyceraldehyde-3-phosphate dehydrogenase [Chitinivibrio alkaliphilus]|uniref:Glyceraldehyde-3-phosphate dehydrogenase n=1 Tax=Chitinivibrio alkaliphilus ACht1 TaxID=1313304 RepID=U7D928_9BACT|nr:type I glyceraldehyde-3-phosphate dehydrogenase [Chitinivibrio alkaliphilus]ERP30900.1 glyceraldehyde-3-P dehydrogenase [Chitinivibrio alkaliphilus ACht1]